MRKRCILVKHQLRKPCVVSPLEWPSRLSESGAAAPLCLHGFQIYGPTAYDDGRFRNPASSRPEKNRISTSER